MHSDSENDSRPTRRYDDEDGYGEEKSPPPRSSRKRRLPVDARSPKAKAAKLSPTGSRRKAKPSSTEMDGYKFEEIIVPVGVVSHNSLLLPPPPGSNVNSLAARHVFVKPRENVDIPWQESAALCLQRYGDDMGKLAKIYKRELADDMEFRCGKPILKSLDEPAPRSIPGHFKARRFLYALDCFKVQKYGPQQLIIKAMFEALLPQLYGDDFEMLRDEIAKLYNVTDFNGFIVGVFPRRKGKSTALAMGEAAMQYADQGQSRIYAANSQQSRQVMDQIAHFIRQIPKGAQMIVSHTDKKLTLSKTGSKEDTNPGLVQAFSGAINSGRGGKGNRFLGDEGATMKSTNIETNFMPGMMMKDSVCVILSSPSDNSSHTFFKMCQLRNADGQYAMRNISPPFDRCRECKFHNIVDCKHKQAQPPWQTSDARYKLLRDLTFSLNEHRARVEFDGETDDASEVQVFFPEETVQLLQPGVNFVNPISCMAVSIDTSGGGHGSETAIVASTIDSAGCHIILGIDTIPLTDVTPQISSIISFIKMLRQERIMKHAQIVLIVEANYGGTESAKAIYRAVVSQCQPCVSIMSLRQQRYQPGVWTTRSSKERMVWFSKDLFKKHKVKCAAHVVTAQTAAPVHKLVKQLLRFQRRYTFDIEKNRKHREHPFEYSGKGPGGEADDAVLAWMQALLYYDLFMSTADCRRESERYLVAVLEDINGQMVSSY